MQKKYKAIFFDWDGTAVLSRRAPAEEAAAAMKPLLRDGVKLAVISGTTYENIAGGKLEKYFTEGELENLYVGLGRGAYNYAFDGGVPFIFENRIPSGEELLRIHRVCFEVHCILLGEYGLQTDIVFSRPNYCKIDLMVDAVRGEKLFMQEKELEMLTRLLKEHGVPGGLKGLLSLAEEAGRKYGLRVVPTCDAKYLEIGVSSKSDNVDVILEKICADGRISPQECAYWGDEYVALEDGIFGSDSYMKTPKSSPGDFFDVSEVPGKRPDGVQKIGGGVGRFLKFLREQAVL